MIDRLSQLPKCTKTRVKSNATWEGFHVGGGRHWGGLAYCVHGGIDAPCKHSLFSYKETMVKRLASTATIGLMHTVAVAYMADIFCCRLLCHIPLSMNTFIHQRKKIIRTTRRSMNTLLSPPRGIVIMRVCWLVGWLVRWFVRSSTSLVEISPIVQIRVHEIWLICPHHHKGKTLLAFDGLLSKFKIKIYVLEIFKS